MKRIKSCIIVVLSLAFVVTGICLFGNPTKEVQAETQYNTDMLSLKFQRGQGSISNKIRVVASVDSPNYSAVGFEIAKNDAEAKSFTINTKEYPLPRRIQSSVEGMEYAFSPKVVDTSSEYFLTGKWDAEENVKYTVRAWAKAFDGTMIYGQSRCITLADLDSTVEHLNMSFELKDGCTLSKSAEDETKYADINVTYNGENTTAEVINVKGSTVHVNVNVDRTTLPSATKFVFKDSDDTECGSTIFRNLYTSYSETTVGETTTNTADTSWYDVYLEEGKDEFVIATNADLYGFSKLTSLSGDEKMPLTGKTIYLCADIEANKGVADENGWSGETNYKLTPIATGTPFNGVFDGQGHTISGIYVDASNNGTGLFRWTHVDSIIRNFTLSNSFIKGSAFFNGSIVGRADGKISNVTSDAIVNGSNTFTGGIAGYIHSDFYSNTDDGAVQIENCNFEGTVTGTNNYVGGIVGGCKEDSVQIINCKVTNKVIGKAGYVGGILGGVDVPVESKKFEIQDCQFTGELSCEGTADSSGDFAGGIVGKADGITNIKDSRFEGKVTQAYGSCGGVVGGVYDGTTSIENCTSSTTATIKNTRDNYWHHAGGCVGRVRSAADNVSIKNSSYTGKFDAHQKIGGIVGFVESNVAIEDSYFDGEFIATKGYSGGLIGYINSTGTINIKECHATGNVTSTGGDNVGGIAGCVDKGTISIESSYYDGVLNASGYYAGGLVGNVSDGTVIINSSNVSADSQVTGKESTGGLVGYVQGGTVTIEANSRFAGEVSAQWAVGGLVSRVNNGAKVNILNSSFDGICNLTGANFAGGLVGHVQNGQVTIEGSDSDGSVNASSGYYAGGLVGNVSDGTVTIHSSNVSADSQVTGAESTGGLVGYVQGGEVTIEANSSFAGTVNAGWAVGGLVGRVKNASTEVDILNSSFDGKCNLTTASSQKYAGGLVGLVESGEVSIQGSDSNGQVSGKQYVGGLVGNIAGGTISIEDSYFEGTLQATGQTSGEQYVGGFVGDIAGGTISIVDSYFDGTLQATSSSVGGMIGEVSTNSPVTIQRCYVAGKVESTGNWRVGGFIGAVLETASPGTSINMTDCLNRAAVSGTSEVGGLIGRMYEPSSGLVNSQLSLTRCLNMGTVTGKHTVGSLIGNKGDTTITANQVYVTKTSLTTKESGTIHYDNVVQGTGAEINSVELIDLNYITVGNGVDVNAVKSTLSGLFTADNTIWTIGTEVGSTPELTFK